MSAGSTPIPHAERARLIKSRLAEVRRHRFVPDIDKPQEVVDAEAVVAAWEERNEANREQHEAQHRARVREIENALILGDMNKVVALLTAYEQENTK